MNYLEAIDIRSSRRSYTEQEITKETADQLRKLMEDINQESELHFQLYLSSEGGVTGLKMSYGMFKNVHNYIALVGKEADPDLKEKIGYYGERLVLHATTLELGTCWVGGTYDRKTCNCSVNEDETLLGIITIGYAQEKRTLVEAMIRSIVHRKTKSIEEMLNATGPVPDWVYDGMRAVQKAPSAVNGQPVHFEYQNDTVSAYVKEKLGYESMDMGIAKYHFELGSGKAGVWSFGNHGIYQI